jgi:hypothetical protein
MKKPARKTCSAMDPFTAFGRGRIRNIQFGG